MWLALFLEQESNSKQCSFSPAGDIPVDANDHRGYKMNKLISDGDKFCVGWGMGRGRDVSQGCGAFFRERSGLFPEQVRPEQRLEGHGQEHGGQSSMCKGPEAGGLQVLEEEPEASGAGMEGVKGVVVGGSGDPAGIRLGLVGCSEGWGSLSPGCK